MPDCLDPPWKEMIRNDTSNKQIPGCSPLLLLLLLLLYVQGLAGAEIRGIVRLEHTGLFGDAHAAPESGPLSVSIFPLHGVRPPAGTSRKHEMEIRGNQIKPLYMAVRRGDRIHFENHDNVYHELFSLSTVDPFVLKLGKQGDSKNSAGEIQLDHNATIHLFCRMHARTYGRIDVLDTPYISMIKPGERFEFRNLVPGKWRVRIALPGAETRSFETLALTSPPLVKETLLVKRGSMQRQGYSTRRVGLKDLYPEEPGM